MAAKILLIVDNDGKVTRAYCNGEIARVDTSAVRNSHDYYRFSESVMKKSEVRIHLEAKLTVPSQALADSPRMPVPHLLQTFRKLGKKL